MKNKQKLIDLLNNLAEEELIPIKPVLICESGRHTATPSKHVQVKAGEECYPECGKWVKFQDFKNFELYGNE